MELKSTIQNGKRKLIFKNRLFFYASILYGYSLSKSFILKSNGFFSQAIALKSEHLSCFLLQWLSLLGIPRSYKQSKIIGLMHMPLFPNRHQYFFDCALGWDAKKIDKFDSCILQRFCYCAYKG